MRGIIKDAPKEGKLQIVEGKMQRKSIHLTDNEIHRQDYFMSNSGNAI